MSQPMVIGVDPSTKKIAVMGTRSRSQSVPDAWKFRLTADPILRVGEAFNKFGALLYDLTQQSGGVPPRVYLEAPVLGRGGAWPTISQAQIGGALMAACVEYRCFLEMVNNQTWKSRVCGNGRFGKPEIAKAMYKVWPEAWEVAAGDQDLIDASAIAKYGRMRTDLVTRVRIIRRRRRG